MFIQSLILCIISIILILKFFYNNFFKWNYYKKISDKQQKVLFISNIINFRNSLFDYCNSLELSDIIYEIENNDLVYISQLLQIKNKIDNYYKQINDEASDDESGNSDLDDESGNSDSDDESSDTETGDIKTYDETGDIKTDDETGEETGDIKTDDETGIKTDIYEIIDNKSIL
jgi:hypothetical protein